MSTKVISMKKSIPCQRKNASKSVDTTSLNVVYAKDKSLLQTNYVISHNFNKNNILLIALDYRGDILRSWAFIDNNNESASKCMLPMRFLKIDSIETIQSILDEKLIGIAQTIFTNNGLLKIRQSEVGSNAAAAAARKKLTIIPYDDTISTIINKCRSSSSSSSNNNKTKKNKTLIPTYREVQQLDKNITYKDYKFIYMDKS